MVMMMMIIIMIMTIIFQAVTTIMLLFLEQVPQVNNGSRVYLPGLLEMNNYASKKTLFKMRRIAQEQENTDETVFFLRKNGRNFELATFDALWSPQNCKSVGFLVLS